MKTFELIGKGVMYVLMALCILLYILCSMDMQPLAEGSWVDMTITFAVGTLCVGVGLAIIGEIFNALTDTKGLIKSIVAVVGAVILIAIFWSLADGTPLQMVGYEGDENTYGWLKISDTSIFLCYFALGVAIVSIVVTEIISMFR